jgi:hypothetical protein
MENKSASINISVLYKGLGNIIRNNSVLFEVYSVDDYYKAVPLLNEDARRIANLSRELVFNHENGKAISHRGSLDGNFHAIEDITNELRKQNLV